MAIKNAAGQPFTGYVSLTSAYTVPVQLPIYVVAGSGTPYTLKTSERIIIANIVVSSNNSSVILIQVTDGATTPKVLFSGYVGSATGSAGITFNGWLGTNVGAFGTPLKISSSAAPASLLTVEVTISGTVSSV